MLTRDEILRVFREILPDDVEVVDVPRTEYIERARRNPAVAAQIAYGVYHSETFHEEFLGVAVTYPADRRVELCSDLILGHMKDVPAMFGLGYTAQVARHEAHHLAHHPVTTLSVDEQMQRELDCEAHIEANWPEAAEQSAIAEQMSTTIQRVFKRCDALQSPRG